MQEEMIAKLASSENPEIRCVAYYACIGRPDIPADILEKEFLPELDPWSTCGVASAAAAKACTRRTDIPIDRLTDWMNSENQWSHVAAMNACRGRNAIPEPLIKRGLRDKYWVVRESAMLACAEDPTVEYEIIKKGLEDASLDVKAAALKACKGRVVPAELLEKIYSKNKASVEIRMGFFEAATGRPDIELALIQKGLSSSKFDVKAAAITAYASRPEIPDTLLEQHQYDYGWPVRVAVRKALAARGITQPIIRTVEPPDIVWKKCLGGVIVSAHIPEDAEIRGSATGFRASKAIVVGVEGDFCGCQVGVSDFDFRRNRTTYCLNELVKVENFDPGENASSTGLHFFSSRAEAEAYPVRSIHKPF